MVHLLGKMPQHLGESPAFLDRRESAIVYDEGA
jgi:hypothetical protein